MSNEQPWLFKKALLLLCSSVLLVSGGTLLFKQRSLLTGVTQQPASAFQVVHTQASQQQLAGHFTPQTIERFEFKEDNQALFPLLVAHYQDAQQRPRSAIVFPADNPPDPVFSSPTGLRHNLWQEAASALKNNAPKAALFLSWWDDGQRVHFLSGKNAWLTKPAKPTFAGPVWKALQQQLPLASESEQQQLTKMAKWLTMDSDQALAEIAQHFGRAQPIYLVVTNDLLLRQGELMAYGASALSFNSTHIPAGEDVHGDIAQVKRWAGETGSGNYLVQKEGAYYRTWLPASTETTNSLLVRLLPFMSSLKQLPKGIERVYQSGGGGYLSVYKLEVR